MTLALSIVALVINCAILIMQIRLARTMRKLERRYTAEIEQMKGKQ